jgi:hypothetical protein
MTFFLVIIDTKELALAQYFTNQRNITSKIKSIERVYAPILITVKNETSSDSYMNLLEKAYVPISAAIIAGTATALGVLLPIFLSHRRKQVFENLIFRELQELSPYPEKRKDLWYYHKPTTNWYHHHQKGKFVHQNIFNEPTENRDFIFSLDPALVYYVTQLWNTIEPCREDSAQWIHYLYEISLYFFAKGYCYGKDGEDYCEGVRRIIEAWRKWIKLIREYEPKKYFLPPGGGLTDASDDLQKVYKNWLHIVYDIKDESKIPDYFAEFKIWLEIEKSEDLVGDKLPAKTGCLRSARYSML